MSDWKPIDLLTPDDQERARKLFKPDEIGLIGDYEFSSFGPKLMRRVQAAKQKSTVAANAPAAAPEKKDKETRRVDGTERVLKVPVGALRPCPLNPRKKYGEQGIKELADTIRSVGWIIHPLVVRPIGEPSAVGYEVIAGHRRLRAAPLAGLTEVPVIVREMSDRTALDVMLSENLQREDLTPIEEAEALKSWLELAEEDGTPRTVAMAAAKHGKSEMHIGNMIRLLRLPKKAREALEADAIGRELGAIIAKMPTEELRKRFTDDVLKGHGEGALSTREAREHARRSYMVELRGSPFDQRTATLVPVREKDGERIAGGACLDCPWNTANMPDAADRTHLCTNPGCYQAKVEAHVSHAKEKALAAGMLVIEGEKARRYVYHDGTPNYESGMVKLDQAPSQAEIVGVRKPPTWKKMLAAKATGEIVTGRTDEGDAIKGKVKAQINVPTVLVIDERGRAHEMVERKTAIEAAKKNGFGDLFSARASRSKSSREAEEKEREAEEREKAKLEARATVLGIEELTAAISARAGSPDIWPGLLEVALFHAGFDGQSFVCKRRDIEAGKEYGDREKALRKYWADLPLDRRPALVVELLLGGWVKHAGIDAAGFVVFAESYQLDPKSFRGRAKAEVADKAPKKKAAKAKKEEEPETVRAHILRLAGPRGMGALPLDIVAARVLGRKPGVEVEGAFTDARGGELVAILAAVDDLTNYNPEEGWLAVRNGQMCPLCGTERRRPAVAVPCVCGYNGAVPEEDRTPLRPAPQEIGNRIFAAFGERVVLLDRLVGETLICEDPFYPRGKYDVTFSREEAQKLRPATPEYVESEYERMGIVTPSEVSIRCPADLRPHLADLFAPFGEISGAPQKSGKKKGGAK